VDSDASSAIAEHPPHSRRNPGDAHPDGDGDQSDKQKPTILLAICQAGAHAGRPRGRVVGAWPPGSGERKLLANLGEFASGRGRQHYEPEAILAAGTPGRDRHFSRRWRKGSYGRRFVLSPRKPHCHRYTAWLLRSVGGCYCRPGRMKCGTTRIAIRRWALHLGGRHVGGGKPRIHLELQQRGHAYTRRLAQLSARPGRSGSRNGVSNRDRAYHE
jgi:hypothetical protein